MSEVGTEATFLLPKTASKQFKDFFPYFDNELENLDVSSYGVSMTTLEEVFLRVEAIQVEKREAAKKIQEYVTHEKNGSIDDSEEPKNQDHNYSKLEISIES